MAEYKSQYERIQESRKEIVDGVIKLLEEGHDLKWMSGLAGEAAIPHNPTSGTQYKGANKLRLAYAAMTRGYKDPRWATINQCNDKGWRVRKGAKGVLCEAFITKEEIKDLDENGHVKRDKDGKIIMKTVEVKPPKHRTFTVFNGEDIIGISKYKPAMLEPPSKEFATAIAHDFIQSSACPINEIPTNEHACYIPDSDVIAIPPKSRFVDESSYISTVTHEMIHSTGHKDRLNRNMTGSFGSASYAKEELVAELGSMFIQSQLNLGIDGKHFDNHAAYIKDWVDVLKKDHNQLFTAYSKASAASDYLYDRYIDHTKQKLQSIDSFYNILDTNPQKTLEDSANSADTKNIKPEKDIKASAETSKRQIKPEKATGASTKTSKSKGQQAVSNAANRAAKAYQQLDSANKAKEPTSETSAHTIPKPAKVVETPKSSLYESKDSAGQQAVSNAAKRAAKAYQQLESAQKSGDALVNQKTTDPATQPNINYEARLVKTSIIGVSTDENGKAKLQITDILPTPPKGSAPVNAYTGHQYTKSNFSKLEKSFYQNGFSTNLWVTEIQIKALDGEVKKGAPGVSITVPSFEKGKGHAYIPVKVYNLDQTIGCILDRSKAPNHPQIKDYIEQTKSQGPKQPVDQQLAKPSTQEQLPYKPSPAMIALDERLAKLGEGFGIKDIRAVESKSNEFIEKAVKAAAEQTKEQTADSRQRDDSNNKSKSKTEKEIKPKNKGLER